MDCYWWLWKYGNRSSDCHSCWYKRTHSFSSDGLHPLVSTKTWIPARPQARTSVIKTWPSPHQALTLLEPPTAMAKSRQLLGLQRMYVVCRPLIHSRSPSRIRPNRPLVLQMTLSWSAASVVKMQTPELLPDWTLVILVLLFLLPQPGCKELPSANRLEEWGTQSLGPQQTIVVSRTRLSKLSPFTTRLRQPYWFRRIIL